MKTQYEKVMVAHVSNKLAKAKELGISASWTTQNHLDALTEVILTAITAEGVEGSQHFAIARDVLGECYNISAFQQMLAKKFEATGHFQREAKKSAGEKVDDIFAEMARSAAAK